MSPIKLDFADCLDDHYSMQTISLEDLLAQSEPAHHTGIVNLYKSSDVHYLVVFADTAESRRGLVAVGPGHDFKSLDEIKDVNFDGLLPRAYVVAQSMAGKDRGRKSTSKSAATKVVQLEEEVIAATSAESVAAKLPVQSASSYLANDQALPKSPEVAALLNSNPTLRTLQEHLEEELYKVQKQQEDLNKLRKELLEREKWLNDTEDRLSKLTDQFMERETNLQKRELALQKRESEFYALRFDNARSATAPKQLVEA